MFISLNVYTHVNVSIIKLECPEFPRNSQQKDSHILHSTGNRKAPKLSYPDWTQAFAKANDLPMPAGSS